jgi:nicotinate-nucleotide--dimethylbenzimidazole phosphoribosyltransferase
MIRNFARGGAAISVAARVLGAQLNVWNLGTVVALEALPGVESRIIAPQSGNLLREPAMTAEQLQQALDVGREAVLHSPSELFIGGEMGIGNTTAATALAAALLQQPVSDLVGPGTGLDPTGMVHKCRVIEQALSRHGEDQEPLALLASLGGFEVAALAGAYLACAQQGVAALVDGFICSVAALLACRINPAVADWLLFSHHSGEPGYRLLVEALPTRPLIDLGLRLGEGSGAAMVVPLLRMACELHAGMATFAEAAVSEKGHE